MRSRPSFSSAAASASAASAARDDDDAVLVAAHEVAGRDLDAGAGDRLAAAVTRARPNESRGVIAAANDRDAEAADAGDVADAAVGDDADPAAGEHPRRRAARPRRRRRGRPPVASTTTAPAGVASTAASSSSYGFSSDASLAAAAIVKRGRLTETGPAASGRTACSIVCDAAAEAIEDVRERRDRQRREAGSDWLRVGRHREGGWAPRRSVIRYSDPSKGRIMGSQSFSQSMFTDLCERMLRLCKLA